jgi:transcriptional regulator with XRE-family HTH domain
MKAKLYHTYLFKDKCPSIDYLRTAKAKVGISNSKIAQVSGVSPGTLNNWFGGTTRRPQFATIVAAARGIGPEGTEALARCLRNGGKK